MNLKTAPASVLVADLIAVAAPPPRVRVVLALRHGLRGSSPAVRTPTSEVAV